MEPYRKSLRRKLPILEPLPREWTEWKPAPAPLDKRELRMLGQIGAGPCVEHSTTQPPIPEIPTNIVLGQE